MTLRRANFTWIDGSTTFEQGFDTAGDPSYEAWGTYGDELLCEICFY